MLFSQRMCTHLLAHVSNVDACAIYAIILGLGQRRRKMLVDILATDLSLKQDKAILCHDVHA